MGASGIQEGGNFPETTSAAFRVHGRVMQEYVVVPDALLKKTSVLKKYFELSFAYVGKRTAKRSLETVLSGFEGVCAFL